MGLNASPLEKSWTGVAVLGLAVTVWMILDAILDYQTVQAGIRGGYARKYGARWWLAFGALVSYSLLAFVWLGFVLIGLLAMQFPPPAPTSEQTVSNIWAGWVLIGMEGVLAFVMVWMRLVRTKVMGRPHVPRPQPIGKETP